MPSSASPVPFGVAPPGLGVLKLVVDFAAIRQQAVAAAVGAGGLIVLLQIVELVQVRRFHRLRELASAWFVGAGIIGHCDRLGAVPLLAEAFRQLDPDKFGMSSLLQQARGQLWIADREGAVTIRWIPSKRSAEQGAREFWLERSEIRCVRVTGGRRSGAAHLHVELLEGELKMAVYPKRELIDALKRSQLSGAA
jgi:hypothetical protein